ncbi:MAG TPA: FKBP-type peptidyl-prolyl cis-trans isomerase [Sphingobacteriaceae bacterium]|nr:FKBP-type peptidyl-prolyl cis-trans isomerase [Sphingobacteriaceae bacterium]
MKKIGIWVLALFMINATGCVKDIEQFDYDAQMELEKPIIAEYVEENIPNAIYDSRSSIWYEILEEGDPNSYDYRLDVSGHVISPLVTVNYTGKLLSGHVFDSNDNPDGIDFDLGALILAWHIAFLPKQVDEREAIGLTEMGLKKGSKIRFVTPSFYGYRDQQHGSIPPNSPLDFTIKVLDIR